MWDMFIEGDNHPDRSILHLSIEALANFMQDERINLLFVTAEKLFQTFEILSKNLSLTSTMPPQTKAATIKIITHLLRSGVNI